MVLDTSVWLSILFDEAHASWCAEQLNEHAPQLRMSTVSLAEALIRIRDRQPQGYLAAEAALLESGIRFVAPDVNQARSAAEARLRFSLNLGDCFVYALAVAESCPILTVDADFRAVDHPVLMPSRARRPR